MTGRAAATTFLVISILLAVAGKPRLAEAQPEELPIGGPGAASAVDLAVTVEDGVDRVLVGREVVYTVAVTNSGPADAVRVRVEDTPPASLARLSWVCRASGGSRCGRGGSAGRLEDLPDVHAGGGVTYTVRGRLQPSAPVAEGDRLLYAVRARAEQGVRELDPTNDADTDVDRMIPSITVLKEAEGSFVPGGPIRYTLTLTNETATLQPDNPQPELLDILPAELRLEEAAASSGRVGLDLHTHIVRWDGAIPGGESVVITLDARIDEEAPVGHEVENRGEARFSLVYDATNDVIAASASNDALAYSFDPRTGGPTVFRILDGIAIPAADTGALLTLAALLGLAATFAIGRR